MNITSRIALLLATLVALTPAGAAAARPGRADLTAVDGEVIVKFRADAGVLRQHTLAARATPASVDATLAGRATALGLRRGHPLRSGAAVGERTQVVRASGISAAALAAKLAADPEVEFAVPNGRKHYLAAPNDPLYTSGPPVNTAAQTGGPASGQWYLRKPDATVVSSIDIESAWARTTGNASIVVAVLDTGVRADHPDLAGRLLPGYDFVSNAEVANDGSGRDADATDPGDWVTQADLANSTFSGCSVEPSSWHGTATASLVGAATNEGVGMAGAAPGVKVLPVRVLGKCFGTDSDIQAGMLWAAGISQPGVPDNPNPARVINMSLGSTGACSAAYQSVVDQIIARGTVIVAAAGNSAGGPVGTPSNCNGVISVLALRHAGTKVGFSDLGAQITIAAPGGNCVNTTAGSPCLYPILAATNTGSQGPLAPAWTDSFHYSVGTSFASPLVAGTVALMLSLQPALTPATVRTKLQSTARAFPTTGGDNGDGSVVEQCRAPSANVQQLQCYCNTSYCGAGMLDAGAAVQAASFTLAKIDVAPASPVAASAVTLSAASSMPAAGATITGYNWAITDGGGIVAGFSSATNAATAALTPSAAGSFTVRLTLTDSLGNTSQATQTVVVAAAPVVIVPPAPVPPSGGGGGGALSFGWLLGLAAAVAALRGAPRRA